MQSYWRSSSDHNGYGTHFLLATPQGVGSASGCPLIGLNESVIPPPSGSGSLPALLCVTKCHHHLMQYIAFVARPHRSTVTEQNNEISL